jgi:hypothetical protein
MAWRTDATGPSISSARSASTPKSLLPSASMIVFQSRRAETSRTLRTPPWPVLRSRISTYHSFFRWRAKPRW